jgi:hypothetical protein
MNDEDLKKLSQTWHIEAPATDLADRIVARATAKPQQKPLLLRAQRYAIAALSEWQTAWAYKLAGLALCAIVGFGIGMNQNEVPIVDVSSLVLGTNQGGSLL